MCQQFTAILRLTIDNALCGMSSQLENYIQLAVVDLITVRLLSLTSSFLGSLVLKRNKMPKNLSISPAETGLCKLF